MGPLHRTLKHLLRSRKSNDPVISYTTDPAHTFLFQPSASHAASVEARKKPRRVLASMPHAGLVRVSKLERLGGLLGGTGQIRAEIRNASLECIGRPNGETVIEYESHADAKTIVQGRRLLSRVHIQHKSGHVRLVNPRYARNRLCHTEFVIFCLSKRSVSARGRYSAIRLANINGGVDVETSHGRITLLDVTSTANARVQEGIIDYSGHQGWARLFAGWEMNLNFTLPEFTGHIDAKAEGPVRVLLPTGFATSFEANVATHAQFVCRADIAGQIISREHDGRMIFRFGEGSPAILLTSINGPIVIDNCNESSESANEAARVQPPQPTVPTRTSINPVLAL